MLKLVNWHKKTVLSLTQRFHDLFIILPLFVRPLGKLWVLYIGSFDLIFFLMRSRLLLIAVQGADCKVNR